VVRWGLRKFRAELSLSFAAASTAPAWLEIKAFLSVLSLGTVTSIQSAAAYVSREDDIEDKMADDTREKDQSTSTETAVESPKKLLKGVVLGKDGKP
jgi:hypothetical protein